MTFKYLVRASALAVIVTGCTGVTPPPTPAPSVSAAPSVALSSASPTAIARPLPVFPVAVTGLASRTWFTVPDGLFKEAPNFTLRFASDPTDTLPRVRVQPGGREYPLARTPGTSDWYAFVEGLPVGTYTASVVERLGTGDVAVEPTWRFWVSEPEYVVWTLDFEGDEASDQAMANTAAIADGLGVPMTVMWNPRAWTTTSVSGPRADAMLAWTKGRAARGDEVALHLHMWTDFVRAAGGTPRLTPSWAGRGDGYDVPMTAYTEGEQGALIAYGLRLMADHGLTGITSFRAGGLFADAATLRAAAANGMTADCSATASGAFGSLRLPWSLTADAQPYRPSRDDANKAGDLALLEAPTNAGNTYGFTTGSIGPVARADLAMLAKPGEVATARRGLTIVSHPATIDATERAAIEALLHAFDPLRYDQDKGPVRFVTLRQLAQAWR